MNITEIWTGTTFKMDFTIFLNSAVAEEFSDWCILQVLHKIDCDLQSIASGKTRLMILIVTTIEQPDRSRMVL